MAECSTPRLSSERTPRRWKYSGWNDADHCPGNESVRASSTTVSYPDGFKPLETGDRRSPKSPLSPLSPTITTYGAGGSSEAAKDEPPKEPALAVEGGGPVAIGSEGSQPRHEDGDALSGLMC